MPTTINTNYRTEEGYNNANVINKAIDSKLLNMNISLPCEILSINDDGTYNIQPIVNNLDIVGNPIIPNIIYDVPTSMEVGGNAGLIVEFEEKDIVLVVFCQRDITNIKHNWSQGNPNSLRKFNLNDAIIVKKLSNTQPTIFIKITKDGIEINSNNKDTIINSQNATINAQNTATIHAQTANVRASNVNLGNEPTFGILTSQTIAKFNGTINGQPATGTITEFTPSTTVKASS